MPTLKPHVLIDLGSDFAGWKDVSGDILIDNPIRWAQGIPSNDPRDRVAGSGSMMLELDNSSDNSAGVAGYYSPGHSDCLPGFDIGCRIRYEYQTQDGQDPSYIIASDVPGSDSYNSDTQLTYAGSIAKSVNSFDDGLYYPLFTSDTFAVCDSDESTIISGLHLNSHTIAYWAKLASDNATFEIPELLMVISTSDSVNVLTQRIYTTATASDATYYPTINRMYSDGAGSWNQTLIASDNSISTTDWVHIAMTVCESDALIVLYVNGNPINAALSSDVVTKSTDTFNRYYMKLGVNKGSMGHVAVWDHVLDSDEVYELSNNPEFAFDATLAVAHNAPIIYYVMGAKSSVTAASYLEQNRAIRYSFAQLQAGYKPSMGHYHFTGRISSAEPKPGRFGDRNTIVEAVDWFDDASHVNANNVPTMVGYTADDVFRMLVLGAGIIPPMNSFDVGQPLSYALAASQSADSLYSEMKRVAISEPGYIYQRAGAGSDGEVGGVLVFEGKSARFENTSTDWVISDLVTSDAGYEIQNSRDIEKLINACEVTIHPVEIDAVAVPIYTLSSDLVPVIPALGELVLTCKYTDTDEAYELVGATEITEPIRNVDYTINSRSDGFGSDASEDVRNTIAAMEAASLISYWPGYENGSFVLSNYKKTAPSGQSSSGGSNTSSGSVNLNPIVTHVPMWTTTKISTRVV